MRRWTVVVVVLGLLLGGLVAGAWAQLVLVNFGKSANAPGAAALGLTEANECEKVLRKLREAGFKQQPTAKAFLQGSEFIGSEIVRAVSYTFIGPGKATVLIDCAELIDPP